MNLNDIAQEIHQISKDHGFYDPPPSFLDRLALMHSELSEALEEFRDGQEPTAVRHKPVDYNANGKPEGIPSEFADVIIRVLDACAYYGIDIESAVAEKVAFNRSRPFKHGRARL